MKRITWTIGIGKDKSGKDLQGTEGRIASAISHVLSLFDGYTLTRGDGGWVNGNGDLVTESSITITTLATAELGHHTAGYLRELFNQESVLWTVEDLERCVFV